MNGGLFSRFSRFFAVQQGVQLFQRIRQHLHNPVCRGTGRHRHGHHADIAVLHDQEAQGRHLNAAADTATEGILAALAAHKIRTAAAEALMGAIYLDRGFRYCRWFIEKRVMGRFIDLDKLANKEVNFKSKLLEWSQKNRINTAFNMEGGTGGERVFFTTVVIEGLVAGKGKGLSKKESQQIAAKEALTKLRREPLFLDSVFQAKEQRTAMEAEEAFALPHIDEIEDILTKEQGKGSKPKRTEQEAPVLETAADAPAASELSDGNETPAAKPRRRRSRSRSAKSVTEAVKTAPAAEPEAQQPASEPEAKNPQTRRPQPPRTDEDTDAATGKPRRRRRSRAAKPAGDAASAQSSE